MERNVTDEDEQVPDGVNQRFHYGSRLERRQITTHLPSPPTKVVEYYFPFSQNITKSPQFKQLRFEFVIQWYLDFCHSERKGIKLRSNSINKILRGT